LTSTFLITFARRELITNSYLQRLGKRREARASSMAQGMTVALAVKC
jgi:hypothetical protein